MNKFLNIPVLILLSFPALGSETKLKASFETRYDNQGSGMKERYQNRVKASVKHHFNKSLEINALMTTGKSYSSDWQTLKNITPKSDEYHTPHLNLRQLYVQKNYEKMRVQLGSIPTIKKDSSATGIDKSGWIDGVRFEKHYGKQGVFEVVTGSILNLDEPNVFDRERQHNYFEIETTGEVAPNLLGELTYEHIFDNKYLQGELKYKLLTPTNKKIMLTSDYIYNLSNSADAYGVSIGTDALDTLFNRYPDRLKIKLSNVYVNSKLGARGMLNDDFFNFGNHYILKLKGKIDNDGIFSWFSKAYAGDRSRFNIGLEVQIMN